MITTPRKIFMKITNAFSIFFIKQTGLGESTHKIRGLHDYSQNVFTNANVNQKKYGLYALL